MSLFFECSKIFSASYYCGASTNKGAFAVFTAGGDLKTVIFLILLQGNLLIVRIIFFILQPTIVQYLDPFIHIFFFPDL